MAEVVRKIPDQLSGLGVTSQGNYVPKDYAFDYAIAGLPFLSGTTDNRPYVENMAEIRKQQFDNFAEPGEQSLDGWWLRSQSTFTGGAGILYQDPDNDNQFNYRFADSLGVDPWTAGEVKLLRSVNASLDTAKVPTLVRGFVDPTGVDAYWHTYGDQMDKVTDSGRTGVIGVTLDTIFDITSSGARYIIARTDGVWSGVDTAAPTQWYNDPLNDSAIIEYVKGRVIGCLDNAVHQLVVNPPPGPLPAAIYEHQDPDWTWKSITDGPTAIYIAGDSGTTSEIHKFTPTISGTGVPEMNWVGVTATMPAGERINTIYQYVGSFVGIATNKGFRVGEIDSNGDIAYGPLLFEPAGGCESIVGFDRFMFVGSSGAHEGDSGLFRVDLGSSIQEQSTRAIRYAYARDIYADSAGPVKAVTMLGASDRKVFTITGVGDFIESETERIATGWLETGRIRFNTEEPKLYKFFSIRAPSPLQGNLSVSILSEGGGEIPHITYTPANGAGTKDVGISQPVGPQNWIKMKFTLVRGVNPDFGGVLNGWQMKALPGSIRQRIITHTFQCFDQEVDKTGQRLGYDGYARDRFELFKAVARAGDVVIFQELDEQLLTQVVIENWEFRQQSPPGPNRGVLGGYLTVQMRTVAEST